jgi:hypothetical protein
MPFAGRIETTANQSNPRNRIIYEIVGFDTGSALLNQQHLDVTETL